MLSKHKSFTIANTGNTRALLINLKNGSFEQLTEDTDPHEKGMGVEPNPKIETLNKRSHKGQYLVFATSGLWENASNKEVATAVKKMHEKGIESEKMGYYIASAVRRASSQTLTVGVIKI